MDRDIAVLLVDDEEGARNALRELLAGAGYQVRVASGGSEALEMLKGGAFDLMLLDVVMPGVDGLEVLRRYRESGGASPVVVLSALNGADHVVRAMKAGATDYLAKPFERSELEAAMARALGRVGEPQRPAEPEAIVSAAEGVEGDEIEEGPAFVSASASMRRVRELIERIADTDVPVLLLGESGVGKEVIAREIHARSRRHARPFLKINCAALPSELLESELFGHERGAFTGATAEKPGKFELAHRGSIFLDEIGEMAIRLQAKMLQVLQDEEFFRVGGKRSVRVDARVVVATNRELSKEIELGNFREDLYYRLNVVSIRVPPLRERKEDIAPLVEHFLPKYRRRYHGGPEEISHGMMMRLLDYDWPGNVRELENMVRRLVVLRDPEAILGELGQATGKPESAQTVSPLKSEDVPLKELSRRAALRAEREAIMAMLQKTAWNKRKAAGRLKISYKALLYKIRDCGIIDPRQQAAQA